MSMPLMKKEVSLLDLPKPILDCILEHLSPLHLCSLSEVCTCLMRRCRSNELWKKHLEHKWGRLLGDVSHREWESHIMTIMDKESPLMQLNPNGLLGSFSGVWPFLYLASYLENPGDLTNLLLSNYSNMALYISLQSGRFWFPAQVFRMEPRPRLYHALLSFDYISNTFRARSPTGEWQLIEENIRWDRLRLSPVHTHPHTLYGSNKNDLKPGDHIEIQKRRRKDLPYDWYYGVIGHLESCDEDKNHCRCEYSEMLVVLFKLYHSASQWRPVVLNRKVNGEQTIGYWICGGIRKLDKPEDIQTWKNICSIQRS